MRIVRGLLPLLGVVLWFGTTLVMAQDETPAEKAYREDYEQYQKIQAIKEPIKRVDDLLAFIQARPKSQLLPNVQTDYLFILQDLSKAEKWDAMVPLSERFIKVCPKVGETYYYYGLALNGLKKFEEAMNSLAKCYLYKNKGSDRAKTFLEMIWKGRHQGKLDGLDAYIAKIRTEIGA